MILRGSVLFFLITTLTCNSFLLIGFDNGVLGGLVNQPAFNNTFNVADATILGLIVSLYEIGCFLGAVACAAFGERLGRKKTLFIGSVVMLIGAILQATAFTLAHIFVARVVSGIGMGLINSTAPVYQSEFSPKASRGMYACAMLSTLNFGIFLSYWIDYGFAGIADSYAWRVPIILQCIFIIPIGVLSLVLPDSPRWLIGQNKVIEAHDVWMKVQHGRMSTEDAENAFERIKIMVAKEDEAQIRGFRAAFKSDALHSRRRLLIACSIQFFQQLGGINGIIYYAGTIFSQSLGFDAHLSALMSGLLNTWFFIASFIPWLLIDRVGRRPLILGSVAVMAAVFAAMAGLVSQIQYDTSIAHACGAAAAAMLFIYQGAFTIGFQATVWVYPPEILPLRLRQTGTALATACNWLTNFVIVMVTPIGIENIGYRYYIIFAIFNAGFIPVVFFFYPETKGLELEDIDRLFAGHAIEDTPIEKDLSNTHLESSKQA